VAVLHDFAVLFRVDSKLSVKLTLHNEMRRLLFEVSEHLFIQCTWVLPEPTVLIVAL